MKPTVVIWSFLKTTIVKVRKNEEMRKQTTKEREDWKCYIPFDIIASSLASHEISNGI